jgi:dTDP-4-dehydrorhamnose 3,5-epimerase-like enzyme
VIDSVAVKELLTHVDERGFLREIIGVTDDTFAEGLG